MMCAAPKLRGWVDIMEFPSEGASFGKGEFFQVYDWSEHHDSGAIVGEFDTRPEAVAFAHDWADRNGRKLSSATVISFPTQGGADG